MRKIGEKVALVAQICVAVVFVIVAMLQAWGVTQQIELQNNIVVFVVMFVLAVIFVGTSAYLVYMNFSELQNLKRILLYADSKSATTTSLKVVNKIALNCADKIDGVRIKRTKIRADEKQGYVATFVVEVSASSVTPSLEQLRCLIEDSFKDTLGLVFNTITFEVAKIHQPKTDVKKAQKRAQTITDGADVVNDIYQNPTGEKPTDISMPLPTIEPTDVDDEQTAEVATEQAIEPVEEVDTDQTDDTAVEVADATSEQPTDTVQ